MSTRQKYHWNVTLQADTGEIVERTVSAFWDPEQEGVREAVMAAGKAEAWWASRKQTEYAAISASLLDAA